MAEDFNLEEFAASKGGKFDPDEFKRYKLIDRVTRGQADVARGASGILPEAGRIARDAGPAAIGQAGGEALGAMTPVPGAATVLGSAGAAGGSLLSDKLAGRPLNYTSAGLTAAANPVVKLLGRITGIGRAATAPAKQEAAAAAGETIPGMVMSTAERGEQKAVEGAIKGSTESFVMPRSYQVATDIMNDPGVAAYLKTDKGQVLAARLKGITEPTGGSPAIPPQPSTILGPTGQPAFMTPGTPAVPPTPPKISLSDARQLMAKLNRLDLETRNVVDKGQIDQLKIAVMADIKDRASPQAFNLVDRAMNLGVKAGASRNIEKLIQSGTAEKGVETFGGKPQYVAQFPVKLRESIFKQFDKGGTLEHYADAYPKEAEEIKSFVDKLSRTPKLYNTASGVSPYMARHAAMDVGSAALGGAAAYSGHPYLAAVATVPIGAHILNEVVARAAVTPQGRALVNGLIKAGPINRAGLAAITALNARVLGPAAPPEDLSGQNEQPTQ